jgi:hypothetical protein
MTKSESCSLYSAPLTLWCGLPPERSLRANQFFALAQERELVRRRRLAGWSREKWTSDPVLGTYRFCNVRREDDRTTVWFRENVRDHLKMRPGDDVSATVLFRWFNRIETGEKILDILRGEAGRYDSVKVHSRLQGVKPLVTGAYMVKTPPGMSKLRGILWCMDEFLRRGLIERLISGRDKTLQESHEILLEAPYLGEFMAYEVVSDLRHTNLLCRASDIDTWASAGPGCTRGAGWVAAGDPGHFSRHSAVSKDAMQGLMDWLLELSRSRAYWPFPDVRWEMREVEHWLCEYDKWMRATVNGQPLKRRYDP